MNIKSLVKRGVKLLKPEVEKTYCRLYKDYGKIDKSPRSKEALLSCMERGFKALDEIGVKYSVGRGLILGFHRDGEFLPNDIDIDIDVFGDQDVYKIIKYLPFELLLLTSYKGKYMQLAFLDKETDVIFDVLFYHKEEDKYVHKNSYGYFWLPVKNVLDTTEIEIYGNKYPSLQPEWFCNFWYGENWRTPQTYDKDWTVNYRRDCKGFIYHGLQDMVYSNHY